MVTIIRSLADTYKEENKKLKLKCELYETYIGALERQRAELKEENTAYKILLRKQRRRGIEMCRCCEAIKELKDIENGQDEIPNIKHFLKARLTSITRKKGIKKEIGVINFDSYDLNYCPMCRKEAGRCLNIRIIKREVYGECLEK